MKYFESNSDFSGVKLNTPVDVVRYAVTIIFLSPIRMCIEISRKILFTGEYLRKFLLNCLILNTSMVAITLVYGVFISKKLRITGGLLPIPSQLISLVIIGFLYFISKNNTMHMDFSGTSDESDFNKLDEIYNNIDVEESSSTLQDTASVDALEELEIIDYDNVEEEINKIAQDIPGTISEESAQRLERLAKELKRDMNFSPPSANIASLYSSVKDKEKECEDIMFKRFKDDDIFNNDVDFVEDIKKNRRDFEELLGPDMTEEDFQKEYAREVEEQISITEGQAEFYRAYEQMNPVEAFEDPEIHMKYEDSFNMNIKAGSDPSNPEFHKFSQKDWEVPMGSKDTEETEKEAEKILEVYNSMKDMDIEIEDPVFDFNDLLDINTYI